MHGFRLLSLAVVAAFALSGCAATQLEQEQREMKCEHRAPTGSNIIILQCTPVEHAASRRHDDQENLRKLQQKDQLPQPKPSGAN